MKALPRNLVSFGVVIIVGLASCSHAAAHDSPLVGNWKGTLSIPPINLRLVVEIEQQDEKLVGTLDSIDQGVQGIPISSIELEGVDVTFKLDNLGARFDGQLDAPQNKIVGKWQQGGMSLQLVLDRTQEKFALHRPQEPQPPFPYDEEQVTIENHTAGIQLAGTLTRPRGGQPCPAVVLVSGSGPQDRDESLMGHKPFWVLADYLTRRGIAVLRYDDRGVHKSSGDFSSATTVEFKDDALSAVRFLLTRSDIDSQKIGICGHSEGGLVAPLAAIESEDVAFIVLMAGPGVSGAEIIERQSELLQQAMGTDEPLIQKGVKLQRAIVGIIRDEPDNDRASLRIEEVLTAYKDSLTPEEQSAIEKLGEDFTVPKTMLTPWYRWFLFHDPAPVLAQVTCPILAIVGERDLQVEPQQNLPVIRQTLRSARHPNYRIKELPRLNHLFQTSETGSPSEYGNIEETLAPAALQEIGDWIVEQTRD